MLNLQYARLARATREAFIKAACPSILFAENSQEAGVGRDIDYYSKPPTPGDLRRLACHNCIVSHYMWLWENGVLGWEQMLLSLSVHLAEADVRTQHGEDYHMRARRSAIGQPADDTNGKLASVGVRATGNCAACLGTGKFVPSIGPPEACADCGGSGNAPSL